MPHSIISLTPDQVDEMQTLGTLTLTDEQWRSVRIKYPASPKRFPHLLSLAAPDRHHGAEADYAIELSRDQVAVLHRSEASASAEEIREQLFRHAIVSLRANGRGEFYLHGKLVPFPTLLKALEKAPELADRDADDKLVIPAEDKGKSKSAAVPRWLGVKLPTEARPSEPVYQYRLQQLATAADQIGLRHGLLIE